MNALVTAAAGVIGSTLTETESQVLNLHYAEELPLDTVTRLLKLRNASGAKAFVVSARRKLQRAVEQRGLRGAVIGTHVRGVNLDADELSPFWEAACAHAVPVVVHSIQ